MSTKNKYHVISREQGWALKKEGTSRAAGVYTTKQAATDASRKFQEKSHDVVIHKSDGTISEWRRGKK